MFFFYYQLQQEQNFGMHGYRRCHVLAENIKVLIVGRLFIQQCDLAKGSVRVT